MCLNYDPFTGLFTWLYRPDRKPAWNNKWVGKVAGSTDTHGHRQIKLNGVTMMAHRLAWVFIHGDYPTQEIDHINRNRSDNRAENLREASANENCRNRSRRRNQASYKGVCWHINQKKWLAKINLPGPVQMHLGSFDTAEAAHEAYEAASIKYFGEFACSG